MIISLVPRIIPLYLYDAKKELNKWIYEARANDDVTHANLLKSSLENYDFHHTHNIGCIGVAYNTSIKAIVLLEKIDDKICCWDISSNDFISGTLFIKTTVNMDNFHIMDTVHDRWSIARNYYT